MTIAIDLERFGGMRPRFAPEVLPPDSASLAQGMVLGSGALDPEVWPLKVGTVTRPSTKSIYYMPTAAIWLQWANDVDVARDPRAGNTNGRVMYSGDSFPKYTDNTLAVTAGVDTYYPKTYYKLGIDKPATASTLTIAGGSGQTEARSYVYTFVDATGSEGPPSSPLTATGFINGTWNFNGMATAQPANHNVVNKNIYRTVTDSTGNAVYKFVAQVTLATANYADTVATTALGETLPSTTWVAPSSTMKGLREFPGGMLVGFDGNELCFSEPYQPHAWPTAYRYPLPFTIVGIGVFNSVVVVATEGNPYSFTGSDPSAMSDTKIDAIEPCVSKRSVVSFGFAVAYASQNGVVMVGSAGTDLVTKDIFTPDQWKNVIGYSTPLSPAAATLTAARYRGSKYIFFTPDVFTTAGLRNTFGIIDKNEQSSFYYGTTLNAPLVLPKGFFVNQLQEEQLYVVGDDLNIYAYGSSSTSMDEQTWQPIAADRNYFPAIWFSKKFRLPKPVSLSALRVQADLSGAHPAYLAQTEIEDANREVGLLDESPIMGAEIMAHEIMGGSVVPYYGPRGTTDGTGYSQGILTVQILAGNSQGRHSGGMDEVQIIDALAVTGPQVYRIANAGKFDIWQVVILAATCRVKRVQLAESPFDLQEA